MQNKKSGKSPLSSHRTTFKQQIHGHHLFLSIFTACHTKVIESSVGVADHQPCADQHSPDSLCTEASSAYFPVSGKRKLPAPSKTEYSLLRGWERGVAFKKNVLPESLGIWKKSVMQVWHFSASGGFFVCLFVCL